MKIFHSLRIPFFLTALWMVLANACVSEFVPVVEEEKELLVVEGMITDKLQRHSIRLSKSLPLGRKSEAKPLGKCRVEISDDLGNQWDLTETTTGTYVTDSTAFRGEVGRTYTLRIAPNRYGNFVYESRRSSRACGEMIVISVARQRVRGTASVRAGSLDFLWRSF